MNPEENEKTPLIRKDILNPESDTKHKSGVSRRRQCVLMMTVVTLYCYAYVSILYLMNQYIYYKVSKDLYPNKTEASEDTSECEVNTTTESYRRQVHAQEVSSEWQLYYAISLLVPCILSNLVFGSYSDRFGRKFLFVLACSGTTVRMLLYALSIYFEYDLVYNIPGLLLEGFTGGIILILQASFAYIADVTSGQERSVAIVIVELVLGLNTAVASFVTGYFIQGTNFFCPVFLALFLLIVSVLIALFLLPETVTSTSRRFDGNLCNYIGTVFSFYVKPDKLRWRYIIAVLVFFFAVISVLSRNGVETLFQLNTPFCWTSIKIGWFGAIRIGSQQIFGIGIIKLLQRCMSDEAIAIFGCLSAGAGFVLETFSTDDLMLYMVTVVGAAGALPIPMVRGIMSKMTPPDKQGAMFGSVAAVEAVCNVVGAVTVNSIYTATVGIMRGFVFLVLAGCYAIGIILLLILILVPKINRFCQRKNSNTEEVDYLYSNGTVIKTSA